MVSAPYLLATKPAAFEDRGDEDILLSRDMEDIVAVLDGRPEIVQEVHSSGKRLRRHLANRFASLLQKQRFNDALPGYLPPDESSQKRLPKLLERIKAISEIEV